MCTRGLCRCLKSLDRLDHKKAPAKLAEITESECCLIIYLCHSCHLLRFSYCSLSENHHMVHDKTNQSYGSLPQFVFCQPSAVHPYEPTAARGHLVQNPGFIALMKDPELGKVRKRRGHKIKEEEVAWCLGSSCVSMRIYVAVPWLCGLCVGRAVDLSPSCMSALAFRVSIFWIDYRRVKALALLACSRCTPLSWMPFVPLLGSIPTGMGWGEQ